MGVNISPKYKGLFWIGVVLAIIVLSWIGLAQIYPEFNALQHLPERVYRIVKTLMGGEPTAGGAPQALPWMLLLVKILVTLMILRAMLKVVEKVFHEQYTQWRLLLRRRHLIVTGAGQRALRIVEDYHRHSGKSAVVIAADAQPHAAALRRDGHVPIYGDAGDMETLRMAGAARAAQVICFDDDAKDSLQVAGKLAALCAQSGRDTPLACFIHLDNPRHVDIFRRDHLGNVDIRFFNLHKMVARHFFHQLPQYADTPLDAPLRILIFGFGHGAQALLLQGLRVFHRTAHSEWHIIVADSAAHAKRFADQYPQAQHIAPIHFHDDDGCYRAHLDTQGTDMAIIALCADDNSARNLDIAAELLAAGGAFPIHVRHEDTLLPGQSRERLHFFGADAQFCTVELITGSRQDALARAIHADYLRESLQNGTESAHYQQPDWDNLPEDARDANRAQADHIPYKLLLTGKWHTLGSAALHFTREEVETLAEIEHRRWMAHRRLEGWGYGATRDDSRKQHPSLIPWDALSDTEKQKDRDTILRLPRIVRSKEDIGL